MSGAAYIHFCLALTENNKALQWWFTYLALYLPAIFWVCMTVFTPLVFKGFTISPYGGYWEIRGPLRIYSMVYLALAFLFGLIILASKYLNSERGYEKRRIGFVFIASIVPITVGLLSDFLLPYFKIYPLVNAVAIFPFLGVVIAYAVTKYDLMTAITSRFGDEIISSIQDAVFITDGTGKIAYANKAAYDMLGYPFGKLQGTNISAQFSEPLIYESDHSSKRGHQIDVRSIGLNTLLTRAGSGLPVTISFGQIKTLKGRPIGMVLMARDLTVTAKLMEAQRVAKAALETLEFERKSTEIVRKRKERLSEEVRFLQRVIDNLPEGVFIKDSGGKNIFANRMARVLFNISTGVVSDFEISSFMPKEKYDELKSAETSAWDTGKIQILDNLKITDSLGNEHIVKLIVAPLEEYTGESVSLIEILVDLTDFVKLEEARLDFVRTAAHELRTPLTSLKLGLEVLTRECAKLLSEEQYRTIEVLSLSIERLSLLAKNLLDLASLEAGIMTFNFSDTNLIPIINDAINLFSSEIRKKKLNIVFKSESPVFLVHADPYRIAEVMINLLSNAVKFTDSGSVTISLKKKENDMAEICVADTGIGIPEGKREMIFTKLSGAKAPRKASEAAGLGLSICKALVEAHRGNIWFESEPGKGSRFYFTLQSA